MSDQPIADTGDAIRGTFFDLWKADGQPEDRLDYLLSALGTPADASTERITGDLRRWLESSASNPAPPKLVTAARRWVRGHGG